MQSLENCIKCFWPLGGSGIRWKHNISLNTDSPKSHKGTCFELCGVCFVFSSVQQEGFFLDNKCLEIWCMMGNSLLIDHFPHFALHVVMLHICLVSVCLHPKLHFGRWSIRFVTLLFVCDASFSGLGCSTFYWQAWNNNGRWPKLIHLQNNPGHWLLTWTWKDSERRLHNQRTYLWMNMNECNSCLRRASITCFRVEYMLRLGGLACFDTMGLNCKPAVFVLFCFFVIYCSLNDGNDALTRIIRCDD